MKKYLAACLIAIAIFTPATAQNRYEEKGVTKMDRTELAKAKFDELFKTAALTGEGTDPELMEILQKFIFGEVFHIGNLDDRTREMITIVTLTAQQTLPQLKAHAHAALNAGVTPVELREAVYQCAPFIGFPKTLNALTVINDVFTEREIRLPLEKQTVVKEAERYTAGKAIQLPLYGNEIREAMKTVPDGMGEDISRFLTEVNFGDFYTRKGLDIKTRELLMLCVLATLGADRQIHAHAIGNIRAGNGKAVQIAAMIQSLPYIGFPRALNAIHIIRAISDTD